MPNKKTLTDYAVEWAQQGVPVFPCGKNKAPLTDDGFKSAVTDPVKVRKLFEFYGDDAKLIGGRMGEEAGLVAIDLDLYKADSDAEAWYKARIEDGSLTETRTHQTPKGGLHLLYEIDAPQPSCVPASGVDVKGDGGYVILPGSPGYSVVKTGLAPLSRRLIGHLRAGSSSRLSDITVLEGDVLAGKSFHEALTSIAAKMASRGDDVLAIQKRCTELLDASVAARPTHDRHPRWRQLVEDKSEELTRIVRTAAAKFSRRTEPYYKFMSGEDLEVMSDVASGVFGGGLATSEGREHKDKAEGTDEDEEEGEGVDPWPYAGHGYFAEEEHDVKNVEFAMYPWYAANETVVMFAEPKVGKTAVALTTALHIAVGEDLGGLKVSDPGYVLYYALEGTRAVQLRVAAWKKYRQEHNEPVPDHIPMFVVERPVNLMKEEARLETAKKIVESAHWCARAGKPLKTIFIDTLTKAMSGGDQNSVEDTSHLFEIVGLVRQAGVQATIVFVHHKSRQGNVRGSSNIEAEPDVLLDVSKSDDIVEVKIARARSIEDGGIYAFALEGVDLGTNRQGYTQTGVIALPIEVDNEDDGEFHKKTHDYVKRIQEIIDLGPGHVDAQKIINRWATVGLVEKRGRLAPKYTTDAMQNILKDYTGKAYEDYALTAMRDQDNRVSGINVKRVT